MTAKPTSGGDCSSGFYALLSDEVEARPGSFFHVLFQRLFGVGSLPIARDRTLPKSLRAYAASSANTSSPSVTTVMLVNVGATVSLNLRGTRAAALRSEWVLTARSLASTTLELNGQPLSLTKIGALPPLNPRSVRNGGPVTVPSNSIIFVQAEKR